MTCTCVKDHNPNPMVIETHHVVPLSWGGLRETQNQVQVCPSTHYNIHHLLNEYVHTQGNPRWDVLRHFGKMARDLARQGWESRIPGNPTPITLFEENWK